LRTAVEQHPDHAPAQYLYGLRLLERDDDSGEAHLLRAMELDPSAEGAASEALRDYRWRKGDKAAAYAWHDKVEHHETSNEQAQAERSRLTLRDPIVPHGLAAEQIAAIVTQLREIGIYRAWLVRRVLKHLPEQPQLVLGFRATRPFGWHTRARAEHQQKMILSRVAFPHDVMVVPVDGDNVNFQRRFAKVKGSRLY
jgi:hypothetical protein